MYSMNYIGKFIANFREFYNEINGATLTGAIDVVVVEQPDGSFTCSPFHVRFGKLGVLRSRFKVVDLELNGEPLNIHMKLGESGEAFFVEEVPEDETEWSAHLATSPIPDSRFDELYEPPIRRNSLSAADPLLEAHRPHNQISDYSQRRYTDGQKMEKPDFSKLPKEYHAHKEEDKANKDESQEHEALFEMEGLDEVGPGWSESAGSAAVRTFAAAEVAGEAQEAVRKISVHNDFRPIADAAADEPPLDDGKQNGKKKKKTKKAGSKKKHQRKSSSSSNQSSQSERAGSEARVVPAPVVPAPADPTDVNFFSDSELTSAALSGEMSKMSARRIPLALSDTAFEICVVERHAGGGSRAGTPVQSDTEVELARGAEATRAQSWRWGELPGPPPPRDTSAACASPLEPLSSDEERARRGVLGTMFGFMKSREEAGGAGGAGAADEGVYLAELAGGHVDPDLYFPKQQAHTHAHRNGSSGGLHVSLGGGASEEEYESGNGPSLPQSPASLDPPQLDSDDDDKLLSKGYVGVYVAEEAAGARVSRAVPYEEFASAPRELLASPRLLVRVGDEYVPWAAAGPLLLSLLAYRRHLPRRALEGLGEGARGAGGGASAAPDAAAAKPRGYSWWSWRRSNPPETRASSQPTEETAENPPTGSPTAEVKLPEARMESVGEAAISNDTPELTEMKQAEVTEGRSAESAEETPTETAEEAEVTDAVEAEEASQESTPVTAAIPVGAGTPASAWQHTPRRSHRPSTDRFRKTLRLSSDQIAGLNLKEGMNEMVFSVTTAYQGTTRCKCNLFRWRHDDKVVISDIDGTITKSDLLGHIFPLVGKDWAQSGVAQLFTKIKSNGYKLLYLSARAIGQAKVTREYLRSIRQGEVSLPDGPLLLNPTSLLRAFHREVIEKKPEEFKIQCLADIKALFPADSNPFYAGYGNRVNDVCAYQAVGIPIVRIFTINYRGELKHELTQTFQSTYEVQSDMVDDLFPSLAVQ